jgi:hypothetical protein
VVTEDVAAAVCKILSTAKTRRYVVTARGVMRILGRDLPQGVLRAVLNKYGFRYVSIDTNVGKYVVDVESARPICEKIKRRRRKKRLF